MTYNECSSCHVTLSVARYTSNRHFPGSTSPLSLSLTLSSDPKTPPTPSFCRPQNGVNTGNQYEPRRTDNPHPQSTRRTRSFSSSSLSFRPSNEDAPSRRNRAAQSITGGRGRGRRSGTGGWFTGPWHVNVC